MRSRCVSLAMLSMLAVTAFSVHAQDLSVPSSALPVGTRMLVALDGTISTRAIQSGSTFGVHTLEPISAPDGEFLPAGTEIKGHVDKVEQAHQTGRARIWLTFDDVKTSAGLRPIVAFVSDIPGVHSARVVFEREGAIEASTSKGRDQAEAAAAGAFVGAIPGVTAHNSKDAAFGAAMGAATAFMISSGLGQELTLDKGMKLELTLDHPFYLSRR